MEVLSREKQSSSKSTPRSKFADVEMGLTVARYEHERLTKEGLLEVIESYKRMNWWP